MGVVVFLAEEVCVVVCDEWEVEFGCEADEVFVDAVLLVDVVLEFDEEAWAGALVAEGLRVPLC